MRGMGWGTEAGGYLALVCPCPHPPRSSAPALHLARLRPHSTSPVLPFVHARVRSFVRCPHLFVSSCRPRSRRPRSCSCPHLSVPASVRSCLCRPRSCDARTFVLSRRPRSRSCHPRSCSCRPRLCIPAPIPACAALVRL
jgi:hypothetical protein